jgi:hypothetical protein
MEELSGDELSADELVEETQTDPPHWKQKWYYTKPKNSFVSSTKPKNGFVGSTKPKNSFHFATNSKPF